MAHHKPSLQQYTDWAGKPLLHAAAVPTGVRSHRVITVAPLELVIVTVTDSYAPDEVTGYRTAGDALTAAEQLMARPDARGAFREWNVNRTQ